MEAPIAKNNESTPIIFQHNLDDLNYEIELNTNNNNLLIKVINKSNKENTFFSYEDNLENLYKLDRYFMAFENIEEIKNNLIELLCEKEFFKIEKSEENELKLILKASIGKKIKNIEFILTKNGIGNHNIINLLMGKINSLENKLKVYESLFSEEIKFKKEKEKLKDYLIGESIVTLNKIEEYNLIKEGIHRQLPELINAKIKLELIFKSSRDGETARDFHKFCDRKGPTVTLIKTDRKNIFGGFLSRDWKNEGDDCKDNKAFLINLKKKKFIKIMEKIMPAILTRKEAHFFLMLLIYIIIFVNVMNIELERYLI